MDNLKQYEDKRLITLIDLKNKVQAENCRQLRLHGLQIRTAFEWLSYLTEEVGELSEAIQNNEYDKSTPTINKEAVIEEAIQVATLALKIAEMYGEE